MNNDTMLGGVYIVLAMVLVVGGLMARRERFSKLALMALAWVAIFGAGFILFTFRDNFSWMAQRLKSEALGTPVQEGAETRIPMAMDGHFWVDAKLNGRDVRFLIDSGATMTTISRSTAARADVAVSPNRDQVVITGNGQIRVATGTAAELQIGAITRRNVGLQVADREDLNVIGMNFLSSLSRWSVEGRWLILVP